MGGKGPRRGGPAAGVQGYRCLRVIERNGPVNSPCAMRLRRCCPVLDQVPEVSVEVLEHGYSSVGLGPGLAHEGHPQNF